MKTLQYTLCTLLVVTGCYLMGNYTEVHSPNTTKQSPTKVEKYTVLESYSYVQPGGSVTHVEKRLVETVDQDYDKKYPKKQ